LGEEFGAAWAGGDVLFDGEHLFGCEQMIVVGGENFGVRACGWRPAETEMAREGFLEGAIAIVRRHGHIPL
jgi:hypothetical protein